MDSSSLCGLGSWRPGWLQRLNSTRGFLVVYGLLGTIQAMSYIYFVATLTTMEKRFKIPSKTTGLMMSGNEISQVLLSLFLSYIGGSRNRPVWIAWGVAFSAVSCFILALPHILYGPGETALSLTKEYLDSTMVNSSATVQKDAASLCSVNDHSDCSNPDAAREYSNVPALLVFLSQFVLGIGTTLYYALGQTYIDDNTKKSKTPLLLGMTLSLRTIGPAFGFILGFACLSLYISPSLTPVINNKDPRWLGAWWLGWLLLGGIMLLFSLFIAMFPKKLPIPRSKVVDIEVNQNNKQEYINGKEPTTKEPEFKNNIHRNAKSLERFQLVEEKENMPSIKDFPTALKRLLKNKLLICNILSGVFYILGGSAYITFLTKYMEVQFHQTAAGASFIIGPVAILAMTTGFLLSGVIISKWKPSPKYLLSWNVFVGLSFVFGEILFIFLSCEDSTLIGYSKTNNHFDLINQCNKNCHCGHVKYNPVCWQEAQLTFYSACHAGCYQSDLLNKVVSYSNCTCLLDIGIPAVDKFTENTVVKTGSCRSDCYRTFVIFLLLTSVMHMLGCSGKIGNVLVNYRAVDVIDKSFAQGLSLLMVSLFAFIPGPIIFGAIIDSTCISWDETCGRRGNCWLYDKEDFRFYINITAAGITLIGAFFDVIVCYLGRNLDLYGEDETKETSQSVKPEPEKF